MTEQTTLTFDAPSRTGESAPRPQGTEIASATTSTPDRPARRVTFETLDGHAVSFTRPERQDGLTPKQQAALNRLFTWLDQQDRNWTDRVAHGDTAPRTCPGCDHCQNDRPQSRRRILTYGEAKS